MANRMYPETRRRSTRLGGYDYRQSGIYFVTICTYHKAKLFGAIVDGDMAYSSLGKVVTEEWQHVAQARSNVHLDQYVVMPNHLHGILIIEDMCGSGAAQQHPAGCASSKGASAGSLGAIISQFKAAVSRRAWSGLISRDQKIWQRNYYDHIVRNEESFNDIRRYIVENPARWAEDSLYID